MLLPTVIYSLIYSPYCPHYILLESKNSALHFFIEHDILHTVALQQINNLKKKRMEIFFSCLPELRCTAGKNGKSQASPDPLRIKKEQAKPWEAKWPHYTVRAVGALHPVSIRDHGWVRPQVGVEQSIWYGPPCLQGTLLRDGPDEDGWMGKNSQPIFTHQGS